MTRRLPAQREFKIGQRKPSGHWQDFKTLEQELQPFLHPPHQHPPASRGTPSGQGQQAVTKGGATLCGSKACWKMPTQQELTAAGRMDLLNAVRTWGGFTAVADRMGVLPNTRYTCRVLSLPFCMCQLMSSHAPCEALSLQCCRLDFKSCARQLSQSTLFLHCML